MAFKYAGDLNGARPVVRRFVIGADCYQGQLAAADIGLTTGGEVVACPVAASALPDATSHIVGIITGVIQSPTYTASYYNGDKATYTTTQATIAALEPAQPQMVEVTLITPTTLIKAPIWQGTPGTALTELASTTAVSAGTTVVTSGFTATEDSYSTIYCRSGANRGQYRKITADSGTTTQTVTIPFQATSIGDKFVVCNVVKGYAHVDWLGTYLNGIDGGAAVGTYAYYVYVHELNLEEAGKEYAIFTISPRHLY